MSAFDASNSGAFTTNYTNDTTFYFVGQGEFTGPPDWTTIVDGYTPGALGPFTSSWIVSNTGGTGAILSVLFEIGDFGNKSVIVTLQSGGGTFSSGQGNTYSPPSVPCFVEGSRILTQNGYKAIETLLPSDVIVTSDDRITKFKRLKTTIPKANIHTAPYLIQPGAFGVNLPAQPLRLSASHKIQIRKGLWISAERAAKTNPLVKQYGVGEPVTYYHIECENYLHDNIVTDGTVVESYGTLVSTNGISKIYTWNDQLGGFTRIDASEIGLQPRPFF